MASKAGGKGGLAKKKVKWEPDPVDDDNDDFLEDLVTTTETDKGQPSYSTLEPGGFVTKGADRKSRLDKRHACSSDCLQQRLQQRQGNQMKAKAR